MSYANPDNADIMRAIQQLQKQLEEVQRGNRLLSPEHIAQAVGYAQIKSDLNDIRQELVALTRRLGVG
jgi:hypothetical protein